MAGLKPKFNKIIIGTFSAWENNKRLPVNGMIEPLVSYFGPKSQKIILIDCPHPGSDTTTTIIDVYIRNKLSSRKRMNLFFPSDRILAKFNSEIKTQPLFKIRDFISSLKILMSQKTPADIFIGLESIHTLAGIIGKKIGKTRKVIYYVSDYSPNRYNSKIFNSVYLILDRFCAKHSDVIWDVSPAMMPARIKAGLNPKEVKKAIIVPNALFTWQIKYLSQKEIDPYSLVFAGTIGKINGLDLAIEAFADAKKKIPQLKFHILGGGVKKDEEKVNMLINKHNLQHSVIHHGFISDLKMVNKIVAKCMVGIAPYRSIKGSIRWYADATKIRLYFASGLPVITTFVPPLAKEAKDKGAALIVKDNRKELTDAIIKIFSEKDLFNSMREKAILFAKKNTWERTYSTAVMNS